MPEETDQEQVDPQDPVPAEAYQPQLKVQDPLVDFTELALQAPGYIAFITEVTQEKDPDGNRKLMYHFARRGATAEEMAKAVRAFRFHVHEDLDKTMRGN